MKYEVSDRFSTYPFTGMQKCTYCRKLTYFKHFWRNIEAKVYFPSCSFDSAKNISKNLFKFFGIA